MTLKTAWVALLLSALFLEGCDSSSPEKNEQGDNTRGDNPTETIRTGNTDNDSNDEAGETNNNSSSESSWESAFVRRAIAFRCDDSEDTLKSRGAPGITKGTASIYIGYTQVSSQNQNPIVVRFDNGEKTWCNTSLETTDDDQTGYGLAWNGGNTFYAAYSTTGSQGTPSQDFRRFATNGWLSSYGSGGGPKAAVIARQSSADGTPNAATFLKAQLKDGKTNTVVITNFSPSQSELKVEFDSFFAPLKESKTPFNCDGGSSPFQATLTFSLDLSKALSSTASAPCR